MTTSDPTPASKDGEPSTGGTPPAHGPRADRPKRRVYTPEYKRRMVEEFTRTPNGQKGAFLRREGIYNSNIREWEAKITAGTLEDPPQQGRPRRSSERKRIDALEKQVAELRAETAAKDQTIADRDTALDVLGKGVAFLEALSSKNAALHEKNTGNGNTTR